MEKSIFYSCKQIPLDLKNGIYQLSARERISGCPEQGELVPVVGSLVCFNGGVNRCLRHAHTKAHET